VTVCVTEIDQFAATVEVHQVATPHVTQLDQIGAEGEAD
jgi:hypothetical protein